MKLREELAQRRKGARENRDGIALDSETAKNEGFGPAAQPTASRETEIKHEPVSENMRLCGIRSRLEMGRWG
jgi:hypothetical protein